MTKNNQETESKFLVGDIYKIEQRLKDIGAVCVEPRAFEYNLRYDDDDNSLSNDRKVLRLRKYNDVRLTFKGPGQMVGKSLQRTEIEIVVSDFDNARLMLWELGYHESAIYEKYRAMYEIDGSLITLDEAPIGKFVEIEGETFKEIATMARRLGLDPEKAIPYSYQGMFEKINKALGLGLKNLTFAEFEGKNVHVSELGFDFADQ